MKKKNARIRNAAKNSGVMLWQIAEHINLTDANFSRMLRRELPAEKQAEIIQVINEIAKEGN